MCSLHWILHRGADNTSSWTIQIGKFLDITLRTRISVNGSLWTSIFIHFFPYNFSIFFKPFISFPPCANLHLFNVTYMTLCLMMGSWHLIQRHVLHQDASCQLPHDCKASLCILLPNQLVEVHFHFSVRSYFYTWYLILH